MTTSTKRVRILLDCTHELWYQPPLPYDDEPLWCGRCQALRDQAGGEARLMGRRVLDGSGTFDTLRMSTRKYEVRCQMNGCRWTQIVVGRWENAEASHARHAGRAHTSIFRYPPLDLKPVRLDPDAPPPF